MSNKKTVVLVALGTALLLAAGCFLFYFYWQGIQAEQAAADLLEEQSRLDEAAEDSEPVYTLHIPAIDLSLVVQWEYSEKALKTSICRYQGSVPGEEGNLVITGHDYLNGAHFGRLEEIQDIGEQILLTDQHGQEYPYTVYEIVTVKAEDAAALLDYQKPHTLTLMTCANNAQDRLLLRCIPEEQYDTP